MPEGPLGGPRPFQDTMVRLYYSFEHSFSQHHQNWIEGEDETFSGSPEITKPISQRLFESGIWFGRLLTEETVITPADTQIFEATEESLTTFNIVRFRLVLPDTTDFIPREGLDKVGREIADRHDNVYESFAIGGD